MTDQPTADLSEEQIRAICLETLPQQGEEFLRLLFPEPRPSPQMAKFIGKSELVKLASAASVLQGLIAIFQGGEWPHNPGLLLERLTRILWNSIHADRGGYEDAASHFASLAFTMTDLKLDTGIPVAYAVEKLGDPALVQQGIDAGFLQQQEERISFFHAWFRDYFSAVWLQDKNAAECIQPPEYEDTWFSVCRRPTRWTRVCRSELV